jgi:hypothetical protein
MLGYKPIDPIEQIFLEGNGNLRFRHGRMIHHTTLPSKYAGVLVRKRCGSFTRG